MSHSTSARTVSPDNTSPTSTDTRQIYERPARNVDSIPSGSFSGAINIDASHSILNELSLYSASRDETRPERILDTLNPVDREKLQYPRPCMKGTREHIFYEIDNWLRDVNEPNVLWVTGISGVGKSAVASSTVSRLIEDGRLGSHFFFDQRDVSLSNPTALWRTVSYDLSRRYPAFANAVAETLKEGRVDPQWPNIDLHFKYLIEEPLRKIHHNPISPVIIIDALDECGTDPEQAGQREALLDTLVQWSHLPKIFKLMITGREDCVPDSFRTACKMVVLPAGGEVNDDANNDIRRFFEARFAELVGSSFPAQPGEQILRDLTARAAGLFIWAETIMRLLGQGLSDRESELLISGDYDEEDNLTDLYRKLLDLAFRGANKRTLEIYRIVVSAIILAKVPLHCDDLPTLLAQQQISVSARTILDKLSPLISVGVVDKRLRIHHPSFTEFLCDPYRCPEKFFMDRGMERAEGAKVKADKEAAKAKADTEASCNADSSIILEPRVEMSQFVMSQTFCEAADVTEVHWTTPDNSTKQLCCCPCPCVIQ